MEAGAPTGGTRWRSGPLSLSLAVVGVVFLLLGGIALYARENVFDATAFADHASEALQDKRVGKAVADPIVDRVIEAGPDELINARPLLGAGVRGVLGSDPFGDAFHEAAARVHRQLFSRDRDQLVLNIADAGGFVIDAVKSISPATAKKIPDDLQPGLIRLTRSDFAISAVRAAESVRFLGLVLPFLGLLMVVGSVAAAPDRRRGIVTASSGIAIGCAVGFIALLVGRSVLLAQFGGVTHGAVGATWDAFMGGLYAWFLWVGIGAIVLAAAASTVGEVDPAAPLRRTWDRISRKPASTGWRAVRATVLLLVSVFVVASPRLALNVAAVIVGAYGLFLAVSELLFLIAPPPADPAERVPLAQRLRRGPAIVTAAVAVGAVVLAIVLIGRGGGEVKRPEGPVQACNGYPELCDRTINEVAFPGAHNAMSAADADYIAPNQETGIPKQLDAGIRVLLIDAHYGIKVKNGPVLTDLERERGSKAREGLRDQFGQAAVKRVKAIDRRVGDSGGDKSRGAYLCHVVCELGSTELTKALTEVRKFLDTHPDEFLIIVIEDYVAPADVEKAFKESGLVRYTYVHDRDAPFPTLRELIESDRRVLVMAENDNGDGAIPWYHDGFELMQETPYTFDSEDALADPRSCRPNRGTGSSPLFQFNNWVEKVPRSPSLGEKVNSYRFLIRRARECRRRRGLLPNLLAVDFYNEGDLFAAARKLNGLPRNEQPQVRKTK